MKKLKTNQSGVGLGNPAQYLIEEGTWTPTIYGGTVPGTVTYQNYPSSRWGWYQRIGSVCFVKGAIGVESQGGATGKIIVSGFPYPAVDDPAPAHLSIGYSFGYGLPANCSWPILGMLPGQAVAEFFDNDLQPSPNDGEEQWHQWSQVSPYFWVEFAGFYRVID